MHLFCVLHLREQRSLLEQLQREDDRLREELKSTYESAGMIADVSTYDKHLKYRMPDEQSTIRYLSNIRYC